MGLSGGGQTREHSLLIRSSGVAHLVVAVNKMDGQTVQWSRERFSGIVGTLLPFLVSAGFKRDAITFVPVSGLSGLNLVQRPSELFLSLGGTTEELEALLKTASSSSGSSSSGTGGGVPSTPRSSALPGPVRSLLASRQFAPSPALASDHADHTTPSAAASSAAAAAATAAAISSRSNPSSASSAAAKSVSNRNYYHTSGGGSSSSVDETLAADNAADLAAAAAREAAAARQLLEDMGLDDVFVDGNQGSASGPVGSIGLSGLATPVGGLAGGADGIATPIAVRNRAGGATGDGSHSMSTPGGSSGIALKSTSKSSAACPPESTVSISDVRALLSWYGDGPTLLSAITHARPPTRSRAQVEVEAASYSNGGSGNSGSSPISTPKRTAAPAAAATSTASSTPKSSSIISATTTTSLPPVTPLRLVVSDVYHHAQHGLCVAGRVEGGFLTQHTRVVIVPGHATATIRSIALNGTPVPCAVIGDNVDVGLGGVDESALARGQVVCWPSHLIRTAVKFKAQIATFDNVPFPLVPGQQFSFHSQCLEEPCTITRLLRTVDRGGHTITIKPRTLPSACIAIVRIALTRPIPLETFGEHRRLGRFILRYSGRTVAAGMVQKIKR